MSERESVIERWSMVKERMRPVQDRLKEQFGVVGTEPHEEIVGQGAKKDPAEGSGG